MQSESLVNVNYGIIIIPSGSLPRVYYSHVLCAREIYDSIFKLRLACRFCDHMRLPQVGVRLDSNATSGDLRQPQTTADNLGQLQTTSGNLRQLQTIADNRRQSQATGHQQPTYRKNPSLLLSATATSPSTNGRSCPNSRTSQIYKNVNGCGARRAETTSELRRERSRSPARRRRGGVARYSHLSSRRTQWPVGSDPQDRNLKYR